MCIIFPPVYALHKCIHKKWYYFYIMALGKNTVTIVSDIAFSSQYHREWIWIALRVWMNLKCFVYECQVAGSTFSWLSSNCMCVISTFWSALLFSFSFAQRVFFSVITLFSSAVWVHDNHEPPKGWKIDEENDSEKRKKMSTINFHHIHIIFYVQTVFFHF